MIKRECNLHCNVGTSDKVYNIYLESVVGGLYVVNCEYGRRGSSLKFISKNEYPVDYGRALGIFENIKYEKTNKGYSVISDKFIESGSVSEPVEVSKTESFVGELVCSEDVRKKALERLRSCG